MCSHSSLSSLQEAATFLSRVLNSTIPSWTAGSHLAWPTMREKHWEHGAKIRGRGKDEEVGSKVCQHHLLLRSGEWVSESRSVVSSSLWPHGLYSLWNSPSQNTGVGSLSLLQGIFPTQGSNPGLPHCRWILYQLSHKGSPRILEWVAYSFSSISSWFRNKTGVSCIAGGFFTTELSGKPRCL